MEPLINIPGDVLLSHKVTQVVPLALEGLTAEFGMGSGVAPSLWSPEHKSPIWVAKTGFHQIN